jgi:hypothetical protein
MGYRRPQRIILVITGLAKIKSVLEMNDIRRGRVTCYMGEIQPLRSVGEGKEEKNDQIARCRIVRGRGNPEESWPQ